MEHGDDVSFFSLNVVLRGVSDSTIDGSNLFEKTLYYTTDTMCLKLSLRDVSMVKLGTQFI